MWLFVTCLLLCVCNVHLTVFTSFNDDESNVIVVPFFDLRYPEVISQFRFTVTDTNLEEKCGEFCNKYAIDLETCGKIYQEAKGRLDQWWKYADSSQDHSKKYYYDYILDVPTRDQPNYPLLKTNYCFVTAFFDLGRSNWTGFERPAEKYLLYFSKLLQINIPLIVFIDDRYYSDLTRLINQFNYRSSHIVLIRINEQFLEQHIRSWQYLSTDEAIMASSQYRASLSSRPRPNTPETLYPRYTCFTHAKMDFVMFALTHQIALTSYHSGSGGDSVSAAVRSVDYLGWIDFGYVRHNYAIVPFEMNERLLMSEEPTKAGAEPTDLNYITIDNDKNDNVEEDDNRLYEGSIGSTIVDVSVEGEASAGRPVTAHRLHVLLTGDLTPEDGDPLFTLSQAPDRMVAAFLFAHHSVWSHFTPLLYHRSVSELHSRGIADDEQAMMVHLYWKEPGGSVFKVWRSVDLLEGRDSRQGLGVYVGHVMFNRRMLARREVRRFMEGNREPL